MPTNFGQKEDARAMADKQNKSEFFYCYHLVAFLDLLGQKERLSSIEGIMESSDSEAARAKLHRVLKETVGTIWSFRKSFKDFFDQFLNREPEFPIPKEVEKYFRQLRGHSKINLQSFSDSTIAWTPVQLKTEIDYAQVLNSIHSVLAAVGMLTPLYLSQKFPFRGGIDLEGGILLTPGGNEIYGPALNRAYSLECKEAKYPRVLVGKGLSEFLDHIQTVNFQDIMVKRYCESMTARCKSWIVIDEENQSMVHFLGQAARDIAYDMPDFPNYKEQILKPLENFINDSIKQFESNEKLRNRYLRLKAYFDQHIGDWNT